MVHVPYFFWYIDTTKKCVLLRLYNVKSLPGAMPDRLLLQIVMMLVNIVMNNTLTHYGALSVYGEDIPLAVSKVRSSATV